MLNLVKFLRSPVYQCFLVSLGVMTFFSLAGCADRSEVKSRENLNHSESNQPIQSESEQKPDQKDEVHQKRVGRQVGRIFFDPAIPDEAYQILSSDLELLRSMTFSDYDGSLSSMLKLSRPRFGGPEIPAEAMVSWLEDRVKVLLDKNYLFSGTIYPRRLSYLARNLGCPIYAEIRRWRDQLGISPSEFQASFSKSIVQNVPGLGDFKIDSARVGLVQLGTLLGLDDSTNTYPRFLENPNLARRLRLSTLFHEARHSDGNGESLCFFHVACPVDHDLEGKLACDSSPNGAYAVGALFLKSVRHGCQKCTEFEKQVMDFEIANLRDRILVDLNSKGWDDTPAKD